MLIFCILPPVVVYVVTVLALCAAPPVRYSVRNHAYAILKLCPNCVQNHVPLAHAPFGVIDQTERKQAARGRSYIALCGSRVAYSPSISAKCQLPTADC